MSERRLALDDGSLVDVLDRLLDVGAYLDGTVLLTLADVDLVRLDLRLLLASVDTLQRGQPAVDTGADEGAAGTSVARPLTGGSARSVPDTGSGAAPDAGLVRSDPAAAQGRPATRRTPPRPREARDRSGAPPTHAARAPRVHLAQDLSTAGGEGRDREAGVAGLVVVLVDIVRQLLERQALRRMDAGTLTDEQVERLGQALMGLENQVSELTDFVRSHRRQDPRLPNLARFPGPERKNSHM